MGGDLAAKLHHSQILNDKGIDIVLGSMADGLCHVAHFPIRNQGIDGQMHLHPPDVAILHCLHQGLGGEILGALAGVKCPNAQINSVCSVLNRCPQSLHGACRCQ